MEQSKLLKQSMYVIILGMLETQILSIIRNKFYNYIRLDFAIQYLTD